MHSCDHLSLIRLFILASISLPIIISLLPCICSNYSYLPSPSSLSCIRIRGWDVSRRFLPGRGSRSGWKRQTQSLLALGGHSWAKGRTCIGASFLTREETIHPVMAALLTGGSSVPSAVWSPSSSGERFAHRGPQGQV